MKFQLITLASSAKLASSISWTKFGVGICQDETGRYYDYAEIDKQPLNSSYQDIGNWCETAARVKSKLVGFDHIIDHNASTWHCLYDRGTQVNKTEFNPPAIFATYLLNNGTGRIKGAYNQNVPGMSEWECVRNDDFVGETHSPTKIPTKQPIGSTTTINDYTAKGTGHCVDRDSFRFTRATSDAFTFNTQADANDYCVSWCGQYTPDNYRPPFYVGFEVHVFDPIVGVPKSDFECVCNFELDNFLGDDDAYFPFTYDPPSVGGIDFGAGKWNNGSIISDGTQGYSCFTWDGTYSGTSYPTKSPIVSTPSSGSTTITDYNAVGAGYCVDNYNARFTYASSQILMVTNQAAFNNYCSSWCGQNTPANYVGFSTIIYYSSINLHEGRCHCYFDLFNSNGDDDTYFTLNYLPPLDEIVFDGGMKTNTPIKGDGIPGSTCFIWKGTNSGTSYPTKAPTIRQAITIANFHKFNVSGNCLDGTDSSFTNVESKSSNFTTVAEAESTCVLWCGQNTPSEFRGFVIHTHTNNTKYRCRCLFDHPIKEPLPFITTYNPRHRQITIHAGTGEIVKAENVQNQTLEYGYICYKWLGFTAPPTKTPSKTPITKAPSMNPTKKPTGKPTKAPITLKPTTVPTKSPVKAPVSKQPSLNPTQKPASMPSKAPATKAPSMNPTKKPTGKPTKAPIPNSSPPTKNPVKMSISASPSKAPVKLPISASPSKAPVKTPITASPVKAPTSAAPTGGTKSAKVGKSTKSFKRV